MFILDNFLWELKPSEILDWEENTFLVLYSPTEKKTWTGGGLAGPASPVCLAETMNVIRVEIRGYRAQCAGLSYNNWQSSDLFSAEL